MKYKKSNNIVMRKLVIYKIVIILMTMTIGCEPSPPTSEDLRTLLSKELLFEKQSNPSQINLYIDLSSSMRNYLSSSLSETGNYLLYENYIRKIFANRQNAEINLYGFGDSLKFIGSDNNSIKSIIDAQLYNNSLSRINLCFDKILKDTNKSLNFVLSDAIYENEGESGNTFGFLISPYIKEQVSKNKLFGVQVNNIGYWGGKTGKIFNTPLYLFTFGENTHNTFIENNYLPFCDDYILMTSNFRYNANINLSQNANLIFQDQYIIGVEIEDFSQPINMKVLFDREFVNYKSKEKYQQLNYSLVIFDKNLYYDSNTENYICDSTWERSPSDNPICQIEIDRKDTLREKVKVDFVKTGTQQNNYKIYKIMIVTDELKQFVDKYNTNSENEIEKTYRLNDFFNNLKSYLTEKPTPLYTFYLVIK